MTLRKTKSKVFRPLVASKNWQMDLCHPGLWSFSRASADAILANMAKQSKLLKWSSSFRKIRVHSDWNLDIVSSGRISKMFSRVPEITLYKGTMVSGVGCRTIASIRASTNVGSCVGIMNDSGKGVDSIAMHASRYSYASG